MTVPFMRAYTELLVKTCHARGAFAMGGMAALIPSRKDPEANERAIAAVREDKKREAEAGFDGTWVAHPDVVDVAMEQFDAVLGDKPNQIDRHGRDVDGEPEQLLDAASTPGEITEEGLRSDVSVGFQYISFWLGGRGAAGINNLMEDAATAEISRSQIWQWIRHGRFTSDHVREVLDRRWSGSAPRSATRSGEGPPARDARGFELVAFGEEFPEFLTLPAYEYLTSPETPPKSPPPKSPPPPRSRRRPSRRHRRHRRACPTSPQRRAHQQAGQEAAAEEAAHERRVRGPAAQ